MSRVYCIELYCTGTGSISTLAPLLPRELSFVRHWHRFLLQTWVCIVLTVIMPVYWWVEGSSDRRIVFLVLLVLPAVQLFMPMACFPTPS